MRIESIVDFCFAALHTIWGADCKCAYPRELNRERARAHYCRDRILPILQTLCPIVRPSTVPREDNGLRGWELSTPQLCTPSKQSRWVVGEVIGRAYCSTDCRTLTFLQFSVADVVVYSTLSSLIRQVGTVRYVLTLVHGSL